MSAGDGRGCVDLPTVGTFYPHAIARQCRLYLLITGDAQVQDGGWLVVHGATVPASTGTLRFQFAAALPGFFAQLPSAAQA